MSLPCLPEGRVRGGGGSGDGVGGGADGGRQRRSGSGSGGSGGYAQWQLLQQQQRQQQLPFVPPSGPQEPLAPPPLLYNRGGHNRVGSCGRVSSAGSGVAAPPGQEPYDPRDVATIVGSLPVSFGECLQASISVIPVIREI